MLSYMFIAALTFTSGECPNNPVRVWEGDDIVLRYDTETGNNLESKTVDLKKEKTGTVEEFDDLLIRNNGRLTLNNCSCSFNLDDLKSGVVTATIRSAHQSDRGLYEICVPTLNLCQRFNVTVDPRPPPEQNHLNKTDPDSLSSQNHTNTTTGGGVGIIAGIYIGIIVIIVIIAIVIFLCKKKDQTCCALNNSPEQQQEQSMALSSVKEPLNPPSAGNGQSSFDPAASGSLLQSSSWSPDMATGNSVKS